MYGFRALVLHDERILLRPTSLEASLRLSPMSRGSRSRVLAHYWAITGLIIVWLCGVDVIYPCTSGYNREAPLSTKSFLRYLTSFFQVVLYK